MGKIIERLANKILLSFAMITLFVCNVHMASASASASQNQNDKIIEKISKDYASKFCNGLAFGLSEESAMIFAAKENKLQFKKKKDIFDLNSDLIADQIADSVMDKCGYTFNLNDDEGIIEFKRKYLAIN